MTREKNRSEGMYKIKPNLFMGQRFLAAQAVLRKIIQAIRPAEKTILEVGAGTGVLTLALAADAKKVIAVEKDKRLVELLRRRLEAAEIRNVELIEGDVLKIYPDGLNLPKIYSAAGNIPYYLTSRLIRRLLESPFPPKEIFLTVQKEVAERIISKPPRMNLLALAVQAYGEPRIEFAIPRHAFSPAPKVDSAFIAIANISKNKIGDAALRDKFFALARAAFHNRRKTLANSLAANLKTNKERVRSLLETIGIRPEARPEVLTPGDWIKIARRWEQ